MARTINEIANGIKVDFVRNETLRTAYSLTGYNADADEEELATYYNSNFSAVSVETCLIYIVATCAAVVENMMDWFTADVNEIVSNERYGHKGWYEKKAKAFQYDGNTDYQLDEATGVYGVLLADDAEQRIIKHASCESVGFGVKLKVATENGGVLTTLSSAEETALASYINRLKPAGIPVTIVNRSADVLRVEMSVYYDPIVFSEENALNKVKSVIKDYLQGIEFNGEFVTMTMVDHLQSIDGLDIIEVTGVAVKHEGYDYESIENDARYIPVPGYMVLADDSDLSINMIANV